MHKQSLGALLKETGALIVKHAGALAGVAAAVYVPFCLLSFFLLWGGMVFQDKLDVLSAQRSIPAIIIFIIVFAAFVTAAFFGFLVFAIALLKQIRSCDQQQPVSVVVAYRQAVPLVGSFCLVMLLVLVKVSLWSLLLVIPGLVFALYYSFTRMILVFEDTKGRQCLEESKKMIQPFFWEFVGKTLVVMVVFVLASLLWHQIVVWMLPSAEGVRRLASRTIESLGAGFLSIFPTAFGYFLYKDFRQRKG